MIGKDFTLSTLVSKTQIVDCKMDQLDKTISREQSSGSDSESEVLFRQGVRGRVQSNVVRSASAERGIEPYRSLPARGPEDMTATDEPECAEASQVQALGRLNLQGFPPAKPSPAEVVEKVFGPGEFPQRNLLTQTQAGVTRGATQAEQSVRNPFMGISAVEDVGHRYGSGQPPMAVPTGSGMVPQGMATSGSRPSTGIIEPVSRSGPYTSTPARHPEARGGLGSRQGMGDSETDNEKYPHPPGNVNIDQGRRAEPYYDIHPISNRDYAAQTYDRDAELPPRAGTRMGYYPARGGGVHVNELAPSLGYGPKTGVGCEQFNFPGAHQGRRSAEVKMQNIGYHPDAKQSAPRRSNSMEEPAPRGVPDREAATWQYHRGTTPKRPVGTSPYGQRGAEGVSDTDGYIGSDPSPVVSPIRPMRVSPRVKWDEDVQSQSVPRRSTPQGPAALPQSGRSMTAGTARFPPVVERTPRSSRRNHPPRDTSEEDSDASSSRSSRRRTRRREKEPMKYDGSTDVKDYLLYFDLLAEMNGWSDRECGLQLATSLVGDAREVLSSVSPGLTRDFASLEQALLTRFSPEGRESSFTVLLWNRTCKKSESVSAFGHAVRKLAKEAYPGVKIHEQILVDIFTKGLPSPAMRRHVHLARPASLDSAIVLATTFEAFESHDEYDRGRKPKAETLTQGIQRGARAKSKHVNSVSNAAKSTEGKSDQPEVNNNTSGGDSLNDLMKALTERIEQMEARLRPRDRSGIKCFNCGEMGHYKRFCQKPSQVPFSPANPSRQSHLN